jgi:hypothetical protein
LIFTLDGLHGLVHRLANGGLPGASLQIRPACFGWHPQDIDGAILVGVLRVGALATLGLQGGVLLLKASEMYLRKIRPSTTCLYSAASMLLPSASAAAHS